MIRTHPNLNLRIITHLPNLKLSQNIGFDTIVNYVRMVWKRQNSEHVYKRCRCEILYYKMTNYPLTNLKTLLDFFFSSKTRGKVQS